MPKRLTTESPYRPVREKLAAPKNIGFPSRQLVESVLNVNQPAEEQVVETRPPAAAVHVPLAEPPPEMIPPPAAPAPVVALRRNEGELEARAHAPAQAYETQHVHMRFKVAPSERDNLMRLQQRLADALGTRLTFSHVVRAVLNVIEHSEKEISRALERTPLRRPANADAVALAQFEHEIAHAVLEALRNAPPMIRKG